MNISNKDLLDLLRKIPTHNASPKTQCPSSKELLASFAPSASKRLKAKIVDHISGCPECRGAFNLLIAIIEYDKQVEHSAITDKLRLRFLKGPLHNRSPQYISARVSSLIAGCLLIAVSVLIITRRNDDSYQFREINTNIILEYPTISHKITDKLVFRWKPYPPATFFILELFDESLLPIWTSDRTEINQIPFTEEARSILRPGKSYFWMIIAYSGTDNIKESKLVRFVVTEDQ
ncbi:MAG: hypothetical protein MZV70_70620 [Desulfobacterales bacterium]|nr:hypothetical protein [Desulfobacterales bacterium]